MTTMEKPRKFYDYEEYLKSMNLKKTNSSGRVSQPQISSANSSPVSPPPAQPSQTRPPSGSGSSSLQTHSAQPKSNRANLAVFNVSSETSSLVQLPNPQQRYHPNGTATSNATANLLHRQRQAEKSEFTPAYLNPQPHPQHPQHPPPPPPPPTATAQTESRTVDGLANRDDFIIANEHSFAPNPLPHQPGGGSGSGSTSAGTIASSTKPNSSTGSKPKARIYPSSNNRPAPLQLNNTRKSTATIARSATTVLPKKTSITRLNSTASDSKFPLTGETVDPSRGAGNSSSSNEQLDPQTTNQEWLLKDLTAFRDRELYKLHQHKASFLPIPPRSPSRTLFTSTSLTSSSSTSRPAAEDSNFILSNNPPHHLHSRGPTTSIFKEGSETPPSSQSRAQSPSPTTTNLTRNNSIVTANMSIYSRATTNKTADHAVDQVIQSFIIDELSVFDNFGQVSGKKSTPETDVSHQHELVHEDEEQRQYQQHLPRSITMQQQQQQQQQQHFYNDKRASSIYSARNLDKSTLSPSSSSARSHLDDSHMAASSPVTSVEANTSATLPSSSSSYRLARSKSQYLSGTKQRKVSGFGGRLRSLLHKNKGQEVKDEELEKTPVIEMKFASER